MTFNCEPSGLFDEISRLSLRVPRLKSIVKGEPVYSPLRMLQLQSLGIHQAKACTITVKPVLLMLRRVMPCVLASLLTQWPSNNISNTGLTVIVQAFAWCIPSDCNWGIRSGLYTGSPFTIDFNLGTRNDNLLISSNTPDGSRLKLIDITPPNASHTYSSHSPF